MNFRASCRDGVTNSPSAVRGCRKATPAWPLARSGGGSARAGRASRASPLDPDGAGGPCRIPAFLNAPAICMQALISSALPGQHNSCDNVPLCRLAWRAEVSRHPSGPCKVRSQRVAVEKALAHGVGERFRMLMSLFLWKLRRWHSGRMGVPPGVLTVKRHQLRDGGAAVHGGAAEQEGLSQAARPILLNGIEDVVGRADLADRAVFVTLAPIVRGNSVAPRPSSGASSRSCGRASWAPCSMRWRMACGSGPACASIECRAWRTSPFGRPLVRPRSGPPVGSSEGRGAEALQLVQAALRSIHRRLRYRGSPGRRSAAYIDEHRQYRNGRKNGV